MASEKGEIITFTNDTDVMVQFIKAYRAHPSLWNRSNLKYRSKSARHVALTAMTDVVRKKYPQVTMDQVDRKIRSLRACHRKERNKIEKSGGKIKSRLWYYNLLNFLNCSEARIRPVVEEDEAMSPPPLSKIKEELQEDNDPEVKIDIKLQESEEEAAEDDANYDDAHIGSYTVEYGNTSNMADNESPMPTQYSNYSEREEQNKPTKRHCTDLQDEFDAIGINVAAKLRYLPPNMRILAEKLINDVLFQAQMNGLNSSTCLTTADPIKQEPIII